MPVWLPKPSASNLKCACPEEGQPSGSLCGLVYSREWRKAGWSSFTGDEGQVAGVWLPSLAAPWKAVLVSAWCRGRPGHPSFGFLHIKEDQFPFPFLF